MPMPADTKKLLEKIEQLEAREAFHRQILADILAFSTRLTRNADLKTLYSESNALALKILSLDYSTLMILSDDGKALVIRGAIGFPDTMIDTFSLLEGQGLSTYVVKEKKAAVVNDFQSEKRFTVPPIVFKEKIVSAVAVPMLIGETVFGVMIGHTRSRRDFGPEEINIYQSIANQSAVAIKNAMYLQSIQDSEKRFRTLIDRAGDAIFLADVNGRLVDVNQMACRNLGYTREELLAMTVFDVDPRAAATNPHQGLWANLSSDAYETVNSEHRRKDGTVFPVEIRVGILPWSGTNYILGFARDVSGRVEAEQERQRLQAQLAQAQKMETIGTLAGGIAHDFNNILSAIMGFGEIVKLELPAGSIAVENIEQVLKASKRAANLVQQILTFSRKSEHRLERLQPHLIVNEALKLLRASLPTTIKILEDIDSSSGELMADPTNIHQIVINLCTNSVQAMEREEGILSVALSRKKIGARQLQERAAVPGDYIVLSVSDTGRGMDPQTMARIFDPYFTTKEVGRGTGLGLAVIQGIVDDYKGFIEVDSAPGKGTAFHIYLPALARRSPAVVEAARDEVLATGSERILVVDDEEVIVRMLKAGLGRLGYEVAGLTDPLEALALVRNDPARFDLVITDQTMPNLSGAKLAAEILKIRADLPVILCTGYSSVVSMESALAMGVKAYLAKPVERKTMAQTVRAVLDNKAGGKAG